MLMAVCHSAATGWTDVDDLKRLSDLREESGNVLWAEGSVQNLDEADIRLIAAEFELHPLAVEDALHIRQRPKLETYSKHTFVVMHQLDEVRGQLEATQIALFIGDRYVLTIHAGAGRILEQAKERWLAGNERPDKGPAALVHTILDVLVDDYQAIADGLEEEMEGLEEIALEKPNAPIERQLYSVKQKVARLRRFALPGSRVIRTFQDTHAHVFSDDVAPLFRDVHDHMLRITDQVRNVEELSQAVLDLTGAEQAKSLNEVNKKLTAWAAIFAVLTLIAGVYGMNFELVPAGGEVEGFWFALALMLASGGGLYVYFKRKNWI